MFRNRGIKTTPKSGQLGDKELDNLLKIPHEKKWFCYHNWIYWKFGDATRVHRVCNKCFKKQQHTDVLSANGLFLNWIQCRSIFNKK
jgi:hypothetical protein